MNKYLFTLFILISSPLSAVGQFNWEPVQINGKPYLSLDQLKTFYNLNKNHPNDKVVRLENEHIKADFTIDAHQALINGVLFYLSEPIKQEDGSAHISKLDLTTLIDPILRPKWIKNARPIKTVILDAGHGGKDKGSAGTESKLTLAVTKLAKNQLEKRGFKVVLTRNQEITVPLADRVKLFNGIKDAVVISLHFNSGKKEASGYETYVMSARQLHPANNASLALATAVHGRSLMFLNNAKYGNEFKINDRGIRRAKFRLLKDSKHPTILIEAGFLSNKAEAAKISTEAYQKALADSITRGIDVYQASLKVKN